MIESLEQIIEKFREWEWARYKKRKCKRIQQRARQTEKQ